MILDTDSTLLGYRVTDGTEVGRFPADVIQISLYQGAPKAIERMLGAVKACLDAGLPYVIHPVEYFLSSTGDERPRTLEDLRIMAKNADLALIVHDETMPDGGRLTGERANAYREAFEELSQLCPVSIENSGNSRDINWFWNQYPASVTLDIGHLEAARMDSAAFVADSDAAWFDRLDFVHLHHVAGLRKGIVDHWGLKKGCRELKTLERLLTVKRNVGIILEVIEAEDIGRSLSLARKVIQARV